MSVYDKRPETLGETDSEAAEREAREVEAIERREDARPPHPIAAARDRFGGMERRPLRGDQLRRRSDVKACQGNRHDARRARQSAEQCGVSGSGTNIPSWVYSARWCGMTVSQPGLVRPW